MKSIASTISKGLVFFVSVFPVSGLPGEEVRVTDSTGEELVFKAPPARVVSLNPDFTDNLFALGAGERVVGVTSFCRYPDGAGCKAVVGDLARPNLEAIVSLSPDLVLATKEGNSPETVRALRGLGIPVFVAGPATTFRGYFELLSQLGRILDCRGEADSLIGRIRERVDYFRAEARRSPRVSVFFQIGVRPIVSAGKGTIIDEMIETAGGTSIAAGSPLRYPTLSLEKVLAEDPGVIIIAAMGSEASGGLEGWRKYPELQAVRNNRLFTIDPDLVCHLGPRIGEGLRRIASCLHPEWNEEK